MDKRLRLNIVEGRPCHGASLGTSISRQIARRFEEDRDTGTLGRYFCRPRLTDGFALTAGMMLGQRDMGYGMKCIKGVF